MRCRCLAVMLKHEPEKRSLLLQAVIRSSNLQHHLSLPCQVVWIPTFKRRFDKLIRDGTY